MLRWEHAFVTAQGSALTRYRRALERRHIFGAEIAAREMAFLSDALGLLALYAGEASPKFDKAAVRWLGRLALESDDLSLEDAQLAAAALHARRSGAFRRWAVTGSNRRPPACKAGALPAELTARRGMVQRCVSLSAGLREVTEPNGSPAQGGKR
jgi:hypothetical protein